MTLRQLLTGVPLLGKIPDPEMEITSVSCDSRAIRPGALFLALPGEKTDGHRYIRAALDKGAAAVLCQTPLPEPGPWLVTEDARLALALVSANWFGRPGDQMLLIGVTGTNGKTTTTHLLKAVLEGVLHTKVGLIGTNRNLIVLADAPPCHPPNRYPVPQLDPLLPWNPSSGPRTVPRFYRWRKHKPCISPYLSPF